MTTETQATDPARALSDDQIAELLPEADGTAEHNKVAHPGGGYEYDEVPAWSFRLVAQTVRAALAIPAPAEAHGDERAAYEAWWARQYGTEPMLIGWKVWQARAAITAPNVQPKSTEAKAIGYMNAGQLLELGRGGTPYGYVYPEEGPGARTPVYVAPQAPAPAHEPAPWVPYLSDCADGVAGHYAIARHHPSGYREVWNLRKHCWGSFSDDVLTLEQANALLRQIVIPTAPAERPATAPAVQHGNEQPTYAQIRIRAELLGRQRLRTDAEVHCLAERAGFKWIEPDGDEDGFPGGFDMSDFKHMRRLVDSLTVDCQSCDGSGEQECGGPETGSVIESCGSCNGTGRAGFGESQPPVQGTGGGDV